MKDFVYRHKRRLAGLLLVALVASPFAVKAESLAEAIDRLTRELTTLAGILSSGSLTAAQQSDVMDEIVRISGELTDLQNAPPPATTMEIILDPGNLYTQAKFKDAGGTLVTADFYFSAPGPTTTQDYVDDTIDRAAQTFGLSTTTLASEVRIVTSFSGPEAFEPQSTTLTTTSTNAPTVIMPGRTNVHHVEVTGDAQDFESRARVIYAPEPGFPNYATSTLNYSFTTTLDEWDMLERLPELYTLTLDQLAVDTGMGRRQLAASTTVSFDKFDNQFEVQYQYSPAGAGYDLSTMFGVYSIVEDVSVTAGDDIFNVTMTSDQDETLSLQVVPEFEQDRDGAFNRNGYYTYTLTFTIHGVVTERDSTNQATRNGIRDVLLDALVGIGDEFGVTDDVVVDDLVNFMLDHTVYYETDSWNYSYTRDQELEGAATCHADNVEDDIEVIAQRYFSSVYNNQTAGTAAEITELYAPVVYDSDDDRYIYSRCIGTNNNYFQNI